MKRCAACGQENDEWRPFCTRCGASYAGAAAEPVIVAPPPGAPPPPPLPGERPPAERFGHQRRRPSSGVIGLAAVLAVAVAVAAVVGLGAVGSKSTKKKSAPTTTFPSTWDPRVTALVHFDEIARKLDYTHPVKVVFLSDAAFKKRVTTDDSKLTAKDRADIQQTLESLRAMGMVQGKVDLFAKQNQLAAATYLAFYDDTKKEIVIPGASLDVEERVTLAHELTHTLDDEHFNLAKVNKVGDQHDTDAVTALVEGDAVWVENQFVAKLSAADRAAYDRSQQSGGSQADLKGVPKIFELLQQWPYDFGPIFVGVLQKLGGTERVDAAFRSPPIDEEQVIDPIAYLNGDQPGPIAAPVLPHGAKKLDSAKEFGALAWYLVLSERIDAHVALKAALGWGSDTYTIAREGKQTCMEIRYRGETRQDNTEMLDALHKWIAALPRGMASVKTNIDNTMTLHSCDPGTAAKVVTDRSIDAYQLLLFRDQIIEDVMKGGAPLPAATCIGDAVTDRTTVADIMAGKVPPVLTTLNAMVQIGRDCRNAPPSALTQDKIDN